MIQEDAASVEDGKSSMPCIRPRIESREDPDDKLILFAVPKKGRLHTEVMKLLEGAGLQANRPERLDVAMCKELPVKLVFLPAADIPMYVMEAHVDLGISGSDVLEETLVSMGMGMGEGAPKPPLKQLLELALESASCACKLPRNLCQKAPLLLQASALSLLSPGFQRSTLMAWEAKDQELQSRWYLAQLKPLAAWAWRMQS
jgi:hypothetical protein